MEDETHLVQLDIAGQSLGAGGVQIARQNGAALLPGRDRKGTDARKAIDDDVRSLERCNEARVLSLQSRVPVHFGKVEAELAVVLGLSAGNEEASASKATGVDDADMLTISTSKSGSPARTSIWKFRYTLSIMSSLLTTVRRVLFFCATVTRR